VDHHHVTSRMEIKGTFGVVASSHWIASQVGMSILERGGNAFDAAVAAGFAMHVAEPQQNSLGGEAVIIFLPANESVPRVICGQGVAPASASIASYRSRGIEIIPSTGLFPAVVPGAFDAWMLLLKDFGTKTLGEVLHPAMEYARDGIPLSHEAVELIQKSADRFRSKWLTSAQIYLPDDKVPTAGALLRLPALAKTYAALLAVGEAAGNQRERQIEAARHAFYHGFVAERIDSFVANPIAPDGTLMCEPGYLTAQDLAEWHATYEEPVQYNFQGFSIYKPGPWCQGPVMLQVLALLRNFDIFAMDPFGVEYIHLMVEASKLAYADRDAWYGDPKFINVPISDLLSDDYNRARAQLIGSDASKELVPGELPDRRARLPQYKTNVSGGFDVQLLVVDDPQNRSRGDTCHIDVIDRYGNVVAVTPSGGWLYGSPTIPDLGFALGTRGQMSWLQEGLASSLRPKARPRTTLSPTIAVHQDGSVLAIGSRGADYQDQWILQTFLRHVGFGFDLQAALDAPMVQCDHWPRSDYPRDASPCKVTLDDRFSKDILEQLTQRGHRVRTPNGRRWGRVCAARKSGALLAAAASSTPNHFLAVGR
jgi:gamma-glutamyltranspeptidase/glutathione hydrolase